MIYWSYQVLISFVKLALNNVINNVFHYLKALQLFSQFQLYF